MPKNFSSTRKLLHIENKKVPVHKNDSQPCRLCIVYYKPFGIFLFTPNIHLLLFSYQNNFLEHYFSFQFYTIEENLKCIFKELDNVVCFYVLYKAFIHVIVIHIIPGPSLEGERGERWLPQVFGTYLLEFQKFDLAVHSF